ncbi:WD repeat-containing protein 43-like [Amphibalanus amphitrite]|uniref:WD repeat-containing protein 43-like n=1 Tax=Amphibalanus amphitrite TaxID=1232801 RepID=UPI001C92AD3F|nr:WD repeat-containing protein 43-like [Amphibalanus amphitrite]
MSNDAECCAAYSDDCKLFAFSSPDGRLKIWDTDSGTLKQEYVPSSHLSAAATCLSWRGQSAGETPRHRKQRARSSGGGGGPLLALGTPTGSVLVYSVLAGDLQTELTADGGTAGGAAIHCVAWDAGGQNVFGGAADGHVLQWAIKNGKVKCKLKAGKSPVFSVCPLPDGATVLTAGRTIVWWELATGTQLRQYPGHATPVTYLQHVPLPGLDGDGGYFVSAAAGGRVVSAWQLSRAADGDAQPAASVSFALSAEPSQVCVTRQPADDAVLVTAVTTTGVLHVFERQLNGVKKKPVKPKLTVRVASDCAVPKPLPVLCARPGSEQPTKLHLCHGSFLRPAFERLPYETDEPSLCLVRADPAAAPAAAPSAAAGRVKTPATDGPVRQLAAGHLSTGRKRRAGDASDAAPALPTAELPLEQRLGGLVATAAGRPAAPPSASSMAQLLVQGLASKDRAMLRTVLETEDPAVVRSTVNALPLDAVLPFIDRLGHLLRFADQSFSALQWLRAVMERHSSYLLTQTDLDSVLAPVYSSVQVRLRCFPRLLQLRGRLDLLTGQMAARRKRTAAVSSTPAEPLLSYRDDSSDDEGGLLGRPPPSPDDVSDMSDDPEMEDQAMEDEDGSEEAEDAEDLEEDEEDEDSGDEDEDELMNGD